MKKKRIGGVLAAAGAAAVLSGLCTGRAFCLDMESYAGLLDKERMSGETEYMVSGDQECRRLLMELVSAGAGKEREEFFITGEDYEPETLVIAQMFPAAVNISNTKIEEYEENGRRYVTCRIGFERQPDQEACTHRWENRILEAGTCLWGGKEELTCRLCGLRKVRSPAALGHLDADRDRLCDRCRDPLNGDEPIETGRWATITAVQEPIIRNAHYSYAKLSYGQTWTVQIPRKRSSHLEKTIIIRTRRYGNGSGTAVREKPVSRWEPGPLCL